MLTAERVPCEKMTRTLYKLSEPTTTIRFADIGQSGRTFDHVVLSLGRVGDTCVFPADEEGNVLAFVGFGFGMGPSRWLTDEEFDGYVRECIEQHEKDGGTGLRFYGEDEE